MNLLEDHTLTYVDGIWRGRRCFRVHRDATESEKVYYWKPQETSLFGLNMWCGFCPLCIVGAGGRCLMSVVYFQRARTGNLDETDCLSAMLEHSGVSTTGTTGAITIVWLYGSVIVTVGCCPTQLKLQLRKKRKTPVSRHPFAETFFFAVIT